MQLPEDPRELIAQLRARYPSLSPAERVQADAVLRELDELMVSNPLVGFVPHAKQCTFLGSPDRVRAFFGGNRSGKTTCGIVDDIVQAIDGEWVPARLKPYKKWTPPFKCRIVTNDFASTHEAVCDTIRRWVPPKQLRGGAWETAYDKQKRILHFKNGSSFRFMTNEQDVNKFGAQALHRVHYDEEPLEAIRKECAMRLIDYDGDEMFTMTPENGMSWMYDAVYERRFEDGITVVVADMDDNPHLPEEAKAAALDGLSEVERQAKKAGKFVHFGGLVYTEFDPDRHIVRPLTAARLRGQNIVVGIDPGIRWMAVCWTAFDNDNAMVVFDEILAENTTVANVVPLISEKNKQYGIGRPLYVIDPSARNRSLVNAENVEGEFGRFGIFCMHGQNSVEAGVMQVKRRLQQEPPAMLIAENCTRTQWEMGRYRREDRPDGSFAVVKSDDHMMDAMRYAAMSRPYLHGAPKQSKPYVYVPGTAPPYRPPQPHGITDLWD